MRGIFTSVAFFLALLCGAGTAQAVKLVSNTGQTTVHASPFWHDSAQAFTTGTNATGYTLTRVDFDMDVTTGPKPAYTVSIHSDSSNSPGSRLGMLTNPSSLRFGINSFTASGGIALAAGTKYWVVVDVAAGANLVPGILMTGDSEDSDAAAGWSIDDTARDRLHDATSWDIHQDSLKLAVYGSAKGTSRGGGGGGGVGGGGSRDDHGNNAASATPLAFRPATPRWGSTTGRLNTPGDRDYFRLRLAQAGVLVLQTTGATDTQATVWQDNVELATAAAGGPGRNFRLATPVAAGEVVIAVAGEGRRTGPYVLQAALVAGYLGNPAPASFQSGIGVISGWVCEAEGVEVRLTSADGTVHHLAAAYGTERLDTERLPDGAELCGDTDNGFGLLVNWNEFGAGTHEVVALIDGVRIGRRATVDGIELGRATVTVTTLDETEPFVRGLAGACVVEDFPSPGETVAVVWQEGQQNFVIAGEQAPRGENRAGALEWGFLGNPGPNSFQSGIGVISGWVCEAEQVEIVFETAQGGVHHLEAAYRTERPDTERLPSGEVLCGDTDNGFGLLVNWNLLGAGVHTVRALVDGEELGHATVQVTVVDAAEPFVRGLVGECVVEDFPTAGQTTTLAWQQTLQNFVITAVD